MDGSITKADMNSFRDISDRSPPHKIRNTNQCTMDDLNLDMPVENDSLLDPTSDHDTNETQLEGFKEEKIILTPEMGDNNEVLTATTDTFVAADCPLSPNRILPATMVTGQSEESQETAIPRFEFTQKLSLPQKSDAELYGTEETKILGDIHEDPHGAKWRLLWYPFGNDTHRLWSSCYLETIFDSSDDPSRPVEFTLGIQNQQDPSKILLKSVEYHEYTKLSTDWGFKQFHSIRELQKESLNEEIVITVSIEHVQNMSGFDYIHPDYDSKKETGMVGIKNQGATCYMNSLLQTLYQLPKFRYAVYSTPTHDDDTTESVILALQRVFYRLETSDKAVSTKELTKSFGWGHMDSFTQHDVQELLRILCDRLEEKMKAAKVTNMVQEMFEGQVRSFIKCVNVDFTSSRLEKFYDLQLDVKGCKSIYDSFEKYIEVEMMNEENQYAAEGYGKQDAEKGLRFSRFPPVLSIHLKRFEYDPLRDGMVKVHDRYKFPAHLDLDRFLDADPDNAQAKVPQHYHLHSVLVHSGDVHGGHYYVYVRPSTDPNSQEWFKFDDDRILKSSKAHAIDGSFGGNGMEDDDLDDLDNYSKDQLSDGSTTPPPTRKNMFGKRLRPESFKNFSSAYMLVYIRDTEFPDIMNASRDTAVQRYAIPEHLVKRFQLEEEQKAKRQKELEQEHLYTTIRLSTNASIGAFKKLTKAFDLFHFATCGLKFRSLKQSTLARVYLDIESSYHIPVSRQRLWTCITRENKTNRPDRPLTLDLDLTKTVSDYLAESGSNRKYLWLYLEILPPRGTSVHYSEPLDFSPTEDRSMTNQEEGPGLGSLLLEDKEENVDIKASPSPIVQPVPEHHVLLFLKFYDPLERDVDTRLTYCGSFVFDDRQTCQALHDYLAQELTREDTLSRVRLTPGRAIVCFEEVQPTIVNPFDEPHRSLRDSEIQHGDIICIQYQDTLALDKLPIDQHFRYLLNRCEMDFAPVNDPENKHLAFRLELSSESHYNDILAAVASHLGLVNALHLRLYPQNTLTRGPKAIAFSHLRLTGASAGATLRDLSTDMMCDHMDTLYYEICHFPISEIESKREIKLIWSPYVVEPPRAETPPPLVEEEPPAVTTPMLVDTTDTMARVFQNVPRTPAFDPLAKNVLRLCEVDGHQIVSTYRYPEDAEKHVPEKRTHESSSRDQVFLMQKMSHDERQVVDTTVYTRQVIDISVCHFAFPSPSRGPGQDCWPTLHSTPFVTYVTEGDTFGNLRERIRRR